MKILNQLTIKHLTMNKRRTIVTIIGVILSTALMVGIGLLFSSARDYMIEEIIDYNGNYHAKFSNIEYSQQSLIEHNTNVKTSFYEHLVGFSYLEESVNEYKPYLALYEVNNQYYEELKLLSGRFPENSNEIVISSHIRSNGGVSLELGEEITLNLGMRITEDGFVYENNEMMFEPGEVLNIEKTKTYKIVGIVNRNVYEEHSAPGYSIFTLASNLKKNDSINSYVIYKSTKNIYSIIDKMSLLLGKTGTEEFGMMFYEDVKTNDSLLSILGSSRYDNVNRGIVNLIVVVLSLISIGCVIVIYNSFAISVMERKKQFGLFSSIGATKKQLRHTVFFEALIIGIIGIPLGILGAFIGIGTVITILNHLLTDIIEIPFTLHAYPIFIIIPLIFMIAVILLSAFLPAYKASKITPIEAIRLNDDIKIQKRKLKTPKWFRKIFGIEGEIALKNMKRNKKKYRITIASLFISIVLFVSFSSFLQYGLLGTNDVLSLPEYDIALSLYDRSDAVIKQYTNEILNFEGVKKATAIDFINGYMVPFAKKDFTENAVSYFKEKIEHETKNQYATLNIATLDKNSYEAVLKEYGYTGTPVLFLNRTKGVKYDTNSRVNYDLKMLRKIPTELQLCEIEFDYEAGYDYETDGYPVLSKNCNTTLSNVKEVDGSIFGLEDALSGLSYTIIVPEDMFESILDAQYEESGVTRISSKEIFINMEKYQELSNYVSELKNGNFIDGIIYTNLKEEMKMLHNMKLAIEILLYGFIALVTLIGVTSVFNTISTSIALRRKEFAMLRSMGMTPKGFNRMLRFESLFFGLKSLLYGLPFSLLVILLFTDIMDDIISLDALLIPIKSIVIAIIGVFTIIFLSMIYSTRKIKRENILEAIREENI